MAGLRHLPLITTAVLGLAASVALGAVSLAWEARVAKLAFEDRARSDLMTLNSELQEASGMLSTVRAYMDVTSEFKADEFLKFCAALHARTIGLRDVGWAPRVEGRDRERFVHDVRATEPGFDILVNRGTAGYAPAPIDADYYPILYVETGGKAAPPLGVDLVKDAATRVVIDHALGTGSLAATRPMVLGPLANRRTGILAFAPVFDTVPGGARPPRGLVFGMFEVEAMVEHAIAGKRHLANLTLLLFDPESAPGERIVYAHAADHTAAPTEADARAAPHWDGHVAIGDRELGAIVLMPAGHAPTPTRLIVFIPSLVALLLTACVMAYLVASLRRTAHLETLTATLRASTENLHQQAEQITHLARHDHLTALPNRRVLFEALEAASARIAQGGGRLAVLQVDLDGFKPINDIHGHAVGDEVLCIVARRLCGLVRRGDVVARLGGDEFALILEQDDAALAGERLGARIVDCFREPIDVLGATVTVGASVGIAVGPDHGTDPVALLHAADLAMYCAKRDGRNTVRLFEPEMDRELRARVAREQALRAAIQDGQIKPFFQPLVLLENETLVGFELLARWAHPTDGLLAPSAFIPIAEEAGLIAELTESVLRQACAAASAWPPRLFIALNVSPSQLVQPGFAEQLLDILDEVRFAPARLEVEITEAALVSNVDVARTNLLRLQQAGCRVALDDFGTGFSSLSHLRELPFNRLKIDRSFILSLHDSAESARIVDAIISLGRSMGVATTAEGIESGPVAKHLQALGCEFGQGYHFGRPMAAPALEQAFQLVPDLVA